MCASQEAVWILVFPSLITQKWWDLCRERLFELVFKFCFHHSILWFLSNKLAKLKTSFESFWVMETKLWWHFCKYKHIEGPTVRALLRSSRNFWQTHQWLLEWIQCLITSHHNSKPHKAQNTIQPHTSLCTPST